MEYLQLSKVYVNNIHNKAGTHAMSIDGSGETTFNGGVESHFFDVYSNLGDFTMSTGSDHTIRHNVAGQDLGNNFDTTNYRFVVPVDGIYHFEGMVRVDAIDNAASYYRSGFRFDDGTGSSAPADVYQIIDTEGYDLDMTYRTFQLQKTVRLYAGNYVRHTVRQQGGTTNHAHYEDSVSYTRFSGYLVTRV
jgi:hypothetical protein